MKDDGGSQNPLPPPDIAANQSGETQIGLRAATSVHTGVSGPTRGFMVFRVLSFS